MPPLAQRTARLLLALLLPVGAVACETGPGAGEPTPILEVAPPVLDWGQVDVEDAGPLVLELRSVGTDILRIDGAEMSDAGFLLLGIDPAGARLEPGQSMSLSVLPGALRDSLLESVLTVTSNGGEAVEVPLTADLRAPILNLSPGSWDFGTRNIGCAADRNVSITNTGRAALRIEAVEIDEGSGGANWELVEGPEVGDEVAPGEAVTARVAFEPRDPENADAALVLQTNDPETPEAEVGFTGRGRLGSETTDTFTADGALVYELDGPAAPFTVQVRVGGSLVFQGWRHDEQLEAVVFEAAFLPPEGSTVRISYRQAGC